MKKKSLTTIIKNKLKETFDWYVDPNHIPTDNQLYYEAIRIKRAIQKKKGSIREARKITKKYRDSLHEILKKGK